MDDYEEDNQPDIPSPTAAGVFGKASERVAIGEGSSHDVGYPHETSEREQDTRTTPSRTGAAVVGTNPKTSAGRAKPALFSVIPNAALLHLGEVMKLGANKYGPFNWRETPVPAEVYIDAAGRHLLSWFDGEDKDPESGMSHLGHVMACCSILIDAQENGMLDDNRPKAGRIGEMISNFQRTGKFNG